MARFLTPVDIANRALQHLGAKRINPAFGFAENSKNASEVASCYDKLRRAELQRNVWTKATHNTAIRPVNPRTAILQPTLWDAGVTYFLGSVVSDAEGTLWESTQRNNIGNQPGVLTGWNPYFGPMTAEPFRSSSAVVPQPQVNNPPTAFEAAVDAFAYFRGELVYTIKGDGTYNVYKSLTDNNGVHPALPNQWSVDTIYKTDDVVNVYPNWSSATTYTQGETVIYTDGNTYSSLTNGNTDNIPPSSASNWAQMPTLTLTSNLRTSFPHYIPGTTPINEWDIFVTYGLGSFVMWNAAIYVSLENSNTGNYPSGADWVQCTGGTLYQSLVDFNQGNAPASSASQWTTTFTLGGGNSLWIQIGGSAFPNGVGIAALQVTWPVNSGPTWEGFRRNAYRLPAGYLRRAPQDPKAGRVSYLGMPSNRPMDDWTYDDNYLLSAMENRPIVFRFVCDIRDVSQFHDMFCEGLACRIAMEVCEPITQSQEKISVATRMYSEFMAEARLQNAVEQGVDEPPLDDWINCRY